MGSPGGERHLLGEAWMIKPGINSKANFYKDMAWLRERLKAEAP